MWIQFLFIVNILTPLVLSQDDSCPANNQLQETSCVELRNCAEALKQLKEKQYHDLDTCGFNGPMQLVCCPQAPKKFGKPSDEDDGTNTNVTNRIFVRIAEKVCEKIINTTTPFLNDHILNGEPASIGEYPHMVGLGYLNGEIYEFDCGGSLVSFSYVLTAAHCVVRRTQPTIARAGIVEIGKGVFNIDTDQRIAEIIKHPNYSRPANYHDLALLRLENPFESSSNLNPICLETNHADPDVPLMIIGWGRMDAERRKRSKTLLKASVLAATRAKCNKAYSGYDWQQKLPQGIIAQQICASDPEGHSDTCEGDSGGPLMTTRYMATPRYTVDVAINRLVGLTSFGKGCGSTQPAVYTRVSRYLDWIEGIVWPNGPTK